MDFPPPNAASLIVSQLQSRIPAEFEIATIQEAVREVRGQVQR